MKNKNEIHIIKEEYIVGKSASNVIPVVSSIIYQINAGDECVKLTFEELSVLGEIIGIKNKIHIIKSKRHDYYY